MRYDEVRLVRMRLRRAAQHWLCAEEARAILTHLSPAERDALVCLSIAEAATENRDLAAALFDAFCEPLFMAAGRRPVGGGRHRT